MRILSSAKAAVLLRVVLFLVVGYITLQLLAGLLYSFLGLLVASVLGAFAAAGFANALCVRIYERRQLADIGLHWSTASSRNLLIGLGAGVAAGSVVLGLPILAGGARLVPVTEGVAGWTGFLFVTLTLLFGAVGEEMMFRGYGFQVAVPAFGRMATILPMAVLFGFSHAGNQNVAPLGVFNTFAWGVLLGWSTLRSGDLWLPSGLHFGWNWALPLYGVNVSGFKMRLTGYAVEWNLGSWWSGGDYGPEAGWPCTVVVILLAVALTRLPVVQQELPLVRGNVEVA